MQRIAPAIGYLAVGLAVILGLGGLVGCKKGTLGKAGAGGAGQINTGMGGGPGGNSPASDGGGISTGGVSGGGIGGRGGPGGRGPGGAGGTVQICTSPLPVNCGPLCGNGRIDQCIVEPGPGCPAYTMREACDGANLGTFPDDCEGFGAGKAVCDSNCTPACSECVPGLPSVQSCGSLPPSPSFPNVSLYAIDATEAEIGLAEVGTDDLNRWQLSFRRLTPTLTVSSSTVLFGSQELSGERYLNGVAVAANPSGWVIAVCMYPSLIVFTVDASGVGLARVMLPPEHAYGCGYGTPSLSARPGGGPLLLWENGARMAGAFVAADGYSVGRAFDVMGPSPNGRGLTDAAWVGDAFQFVTNVFAEDGSVSLRLTRIDPDGSVTGRDLLKNEVYNVARLARGASDVRLTYVGRLPGDAGAFEDSAVKWTRLGPLDQVLAAVNLTGATEFWRDSPSVAFGDDTVVLLADSPGSLSLTRLGPDGKPVTDPYAFLRAPFYALGAGFSLVRRGPDVIVSWYTAGTATTRVGLARVSP